MQERTVAVFSATTSKGNENEIPRTNSNIQAVDDNEETNSSNGEVWIFTVENGDILLPISSEQEAEQDAEIKDEDFGQAVNPLNKHSKTKLLEATKQLSSTEHLLSKTA